MKKELAQKYNPQEVEADKYEYWLTENCFYADAQSDKEPFTIVIPPPNVTGKLHIGHAWDTAIQDIIIRMKRMQGYNALFLPGMDHAGIATQAKVEERLRTEGILRHDLGRDRFIERVWDWKDEYATSIREQWYKLGLSLDYTKERFTLDDGLSAAVRKVFVDLYQKGLIYRGKRIINWDPVQKTALSNIEVIYKDIEGFEHYFKYMFADGSGRYLTIMTTRPETMFGDGAIAVNPADERYQELLGEEVIVPITGYKIPIIADAYVDMEKGSGCVKITPAHDPNDYEVGLRHNIKQDIIMNTDGTMAATDRVPKNYQGLDRFVARKQYIADCEAAGLLEKMVPIVHSVGHSERSGAIVEPYLSKQWMVKMQPLATQAIAAQKAAATHIDFYPNRFEKVYVRWMEEMHDWCISRQLWWGHQIPAWYHKETGEVYVGMAAPHDAENWRQDEDVLDTWFSSALWPFSTLGWPDTSQNLYQKFFPTNVLVTGYDIIFFWVSRMIFQSLEFTKQQPFHDVLIHGLVRAADGRKMSKSLGNGIDPMDVIAQYGADSLRYFLVTNTSPGQDLRYNEEKIIAASNFANKIWNAARFVLLNNTETDTNFDPKELDSSDYWILNKLNSTIETILYNTDKYEFGEVGRSLYSFIWDNFCDWYIELSKPVLYGESPIKKQQKHKMLLFILEKIIALLHPFMPYITEEIWQALPQTSGALAVASYPTTLDLPMKTAELEQVELLMEAISGMRQIRAAYHVAPSKKLPIILECANIEIVEQLTLSYTYLTQFMHTDELIITEKAPHVAQAERKVCSKFVLIVPLETLVDFAAQREKLTKEKQRLEQEIMRCEKMLANENFVSKAPQQKITEEQQKLVDYTKQLALVVEQITQLPA